jgi:outer membrane protein TolC
VIRVFFNSVAIIMIFFVLQVKAHHPNEGELSLESLTQEALDHNLELKTAEIKLEAKSFQQKAGTGVFYPEVSIEGGPRISKLNDEKHSSIAAFGKAEWNLYHGGRDISEKRKLDLDYELTKKQFEQVKAKITRDAARIYYELMFLLESIAIKDEALRLNQEQIKLADKKRSAGFTSKADVIEFELRETTINSDLKDLIQEKENKSRELSILLGRNVSEANLATKGHLERGKLVFNKEKIMQAIDDFSPDLNEAKINLEKSRAEKEIARSEFFPKLDLEAKYGKLANEERAYDGNNNYTLGVTINIPLFSGFSSKNELSASTLEISAFETQIRKQTLAIKTEAENLLAKLSITLNRLEIEEKTLSRSEQYYQITLDEYRRGVKNSPDMVGASERVLNSKIRNLEFRRDFQITKLKLLELVGVDLNSKLLL